jgi:hypothetical protein
MFKTVEGVNRAGQIEWAEEPREMDGARVLVTFLPSRHPVDLRAQGVSKEEAAGFRASLGEAIADWEDPALDIYDEP